MQQPVKKKLSPVARLPFFPTYPNFSVSKIFQHSASSETPSPNLIVRFFRYPVLYEESLNTVLIQEAIRYNRLLAVIQSTLKDLLKAIKGLVVMSEALDKMSLSLYSNLVPDLWASKAYPSLKPLGTTKLAQNLSHQCFVGSWVADLNARCDFLIKWIQQGNPPVFWISGFYFPPAFLTATLQNFARKYVVSIDTINFSFKVLQIFSDSV